jgi:hypothetical protein
MAKSPVAPDDIITDEFIITRRFRTADAFSLHIETEASRTHVSCLDTLVAYCEEADIDVESVAILVNSSLKARLQAEAEALHLIRKTITGHLPI